MNKIPSSVRAYLATIGARGGKAKSPQKSAAAKSNGQSGGRSTNLRALPLATDDPSSAGAQFFKNKAEVVAWLMASFPNEAWYPSWNLNKLKKAMQKVGLLLEWD